jgi:hypothetical protein
VAERYSSFLFDLIIKSIAYSYKLKGFSRLISELNKPCAYGRPKQPHIGSDIIELLSCGVQCFAGFCLMQQANI